MKSIVHAARRAPTPVNQAFRYCKATPLPLPGILFMVIAAAGFGEETLFRSYASSGCDGWWGTSAAGHHPTVVDVRGSAPALPFQVFPGVQQATIRRDVIFGTIYAVTRTISMLMLAHAAFDVTRSQ